MAALNKMSHVAILYNLQEAVSCKNRVHPHHVRSRARAYSYWEHLAAGILLLQIATAGRRLYEMEKNVQSITAVH